MIRKHRCSNYNIWHWSASYILTSDGVHVVHVGHTLQSLSFVLNPDCWEPTTILALIISANAGHCKIESGQRQYRTILWEWPVHCLARTCATQVEWVSVCFCCDDIVMTVNMWHVRGTVSGICLVDDAHTDSTQQTSSLPFHFRCLFAANKQSVFLLLKEEILIIRCRGDLPRGLNAIIHRLWLYITNKGGSLSECNTKAFTNLQMAFSGAFTFLVFLWIRRTCDKNNAHRRMQVLFCVSLQQHKCFSHPTVCSIWPVYSQ
jgi:hypothetical protein